jgi:hypothetical protein
MSLERRSAKVWESRRAWLAIDSSKSDVRANPEVKLAISRDTPTGACCAPMMVVWCVLKMHMPRVAQLDVGT